MSPKEHANLLGIFFWVLGSIQGIFLLFILLYMLFFGFISLQAITSGPGTDREAATVFIVIFVFILLYFLLAVFFCAANVIAGYGLRNDKPWARVWSTVGSIMALLSFLCGGIWIMPFGIALGVYGLWFIYGVYGQYYFAHLSQPQMLSPQIPKTLYSYTPPNQYY